VDIKSYVKVQGEYNVLDFKFTVKTAINTDDTYNPPVATPGYVFIEFPRAQGWEEGLGIKNEFLAGV
jgi:hypothetical protein